MDSQAVVVFFDDCCNEFWMISTYIVKGICRGELPYAAYHMEAVVRPQLLTMLSWKIGTETSFDYSLGKHYKCIRRYLTGTEWREHTAWTKPEPAAPIAAAFINAKRALVSFGRKCESAEELLPYKKIE